MDGPPFKNQWWDELKSPRHCPFDFRLLLADCRLPNGLSTGQGAYLVEGKVVQDFGYLSVEVEKLGRLSFMADGRME